MQLNPARLSRSIFITESTFKADGFYDEQRNLLSTKK